LPIVNSLPESFLTVEDIEFDLPFEHSLFHTKLDTFVPKIVFDESILKPYISKHQPINPDSDEDVVK